MTQKYRNEIFNIAIKHAGHDILEEISEETPVSDGLSFSDKFERKMEEIVRKEARRRRVLSALKITAKVAAVILVVLIVSTGVVFSSEALRLKVMNLFYESDEISTEIDFSGIEPGDIPEGMVLPGYMPEGYVLTEVEKTESGLYTSIYTNSSDNIIKIEQGNFVAHFSADNENEDAYQAEFMGTEIYVVEHDEMNMVFFNGNYYSFSIWGNIEISELLAIAESVLK